MKCPNSCLYFLIRSHQKSSKRVNEGVLVIVQAHSTIEDLIPSLLICEQTYIEPESLSSAEIKVACAYTII